MSRVGLVAELLLILYTVVIRLVLSAACDDEVIPLQERIETVTDDTDLEEVYNTERHLLYVACTRARDHLLVTSRILHRAEIIQITGKSYRLKDRARMNRETYQNNQNGKKDKTGREDTTDKKDKTCQKEKTAS